MRNKRANEQADQAAARLIWLKGSPSKQWAGRARRLLVAPDERRAGRPAHLAADQLSGEPAGEPIG